MWSPRRLRCRPSSAPGQVVTGVVVDATGAVLPNADIVLTSASNATITTTTDATGTFRFADVPAGRYEVRASFEGFQPTTVRVTVGSRAPSPLRVALPLASVKQEITVSNQAAEVNKRGDQCATAAFRTIQILSS